jgi:hypothetical protein
VSMDRFIVKGEEAKASTQRHFDREHDQHRRKRADNNEQGEEKKETAAVVIARLAEGKVTELWEDVQKLQQPAHHISATCSQLSRFDGRYSLNNKGYVQVKTSTEKNLRDTNEKVQLHHLAIWHHPNPQYRATVQQKLREGKHKLEVSHLCNFKKCCNPAHMCLEPSAINKSRNFCVALVYTPTNQRFGTCEHEPRCVVTTASRTLHLAVDRELK